jgi:hypothetical protein
MNLAFTEERLPTRRYILKFTRHRVPGGWYVRCIHTGLGYGAGGHNEHALFLADPEHLWNHDNIRWEMLQKEPMGGIYRLKVYNGWLLFSSCQGTAKTEDGAKYHPRFGSLVHVPDPEHRWDCKTLQEKDPVFGF